MEAARAIAKRHGNRAFRRRLTDYEAVQFLNDLTRRGILDVSGGSLAHCGEIFDQKSDLFEDYVAVRIDADAVGDAHRLLGDLSG